MGSANFNRRSCGFSDEVNLLFGDKKSVGKVVRNLEELKKHCRPVGMEEARRYRNPIYYVHWIVMQMLG
jgi:phosphatidylserine/phosphatidylglycerophosphate/cardiolipin synthase-like enzyme